MTPTLKSELEQLSGWKVPEHDVLEWLLGRLPLTTYVWSVYDPIAGKEYGAEVGHNYQVSAQFADTPQNVLCKLAIALFRAGVLKKGEV